MAFANPYDVRFPDGEWHTVLPFAWRVAKHLTPAQRIWFNEAIARGGVFTVHTKQQVHNAPRFMRTVVSAALQAARATAAARADISPAAPFVYGSGLLRFVP